MIIKSVRVSAASGVSRLARHVFHGAENEEIAILRGTEDDVADMQRDARAARATYAVRHWIVAPHEPTTREQALTVVALLAEEFVFDAARAVVVEHRKPRAAVTATDVHWHLLVPELNAVTGRVLASSHDRPRHELIARRSEFAFGHAPLLGRHTVSVLARLRAAGHMDVVRWLAAATTGAASLPREAFSHAAHQAARRLGVDLAAARSVVKSAWLASPTRDAFVAALASNGLTVASGEKPGVWVVNTATGELVGSLARLAGARKADVARKMKEKVHVEDAHHRTRHPAGHAGPTGGARPDREARDGCEGSDDILAGGDAPRHADGDRPRTRGDQDLPGSAASGNGGDAFGQSATRAACDVALELSAPAFSTEIALALGRANVVALTAEERAVRHIVEITEWAEREIALANAEVPESPRLLNAREASAEARRRRTDARRHVRDMEARLAAIPAARWWSWFTGARKKRRDRVAAFSHDVAAAEVALNEAERLEVAAAAALARETRHFHAEALVEKRRRQAALPGATEALELAHEAMAALREAPHLAPLGSVRLFEIAEEQLKSRKTEPSATAEAEPPVPQMRLA